MDNIVCTARTLICKVDPMFWSPKTVIIKTNHHLAGTWLLMAVFEFFNNEGIKFTTFQLVIDALCYHFYWEISWNKSFTGVIDCLAVYLKIYYCSGRNHLLLVSILKLCVIALFVKSKSMCGFLGLRLTFSLVILFSTLPYTRFSVWSSSTQSIFKVDVNC